MNRRSPALLIFILAFVCGLLQLFLAPRFGFGQGWEAVAIARELYRHGTYGNPFQAGPSGPTAVIVPMFPICLAALMKVLGDGLVPVIAATAVALIAQALQAALLPRASAKLFGSALPGIFAGVLSAFAFQLMPQWDAPTTACGVVAFVGFMSIRSRRGAAWSGVAAGLLLLMNPASILITVPWVIYLCLFRKALFARLVPFAAAVLLVASPWLIRNYRRLGTFSVKDNFGMTVYASNNDCASSSLTASAASGCYDGLHPNRSARELAILNQIGEVAYDRLRTDDTIHWIRSHPRKFTRLTASRIMEFWFPSPLPGWFDIYAVWLVTGLSVPGLFLLCRRRDPAGIYILAVSTLYPLMYYVVVSDVRYRYPLLWVSLLGAGYLLSHARGRSPDRVSETAQIEVG